MPFHQHKYYWLYKPFQVLSQFSKEGDKLTLADCFEQIEKDVYPVGRLDYDSEGLILLTNDKELTHKLLHPKFQHERTYYAQVEGDITPEAITQMQEGVTISVNGAKYKTLPAQVRKIEEPALPERNPPIRFRQNIPTSWVAITLTEGKNRQVRKMTAAVNFPTLRLVRFSIGKRNIDGMDSGAFLVETAVRESDIFPILSKGIKKPKS